MTSDAKRALAKTIRVLREKIILPDSGAPSVEAPTVEALIEALDPAVRAAIAVPSEPPKVDDGHKTESHP